MDDKQDLNKEIKSEIVKAIVRLGGKSDLIATINSWGEEMPDEDTLADLKKWNNVTLEARQKDLSNLLEFYK